MSDEHIVRIFCRIRYSSSFLRGLKLNWSPGTDKKRKISFKWPASLQYQIPAEPWRNPFRASIEDHPNSSIFRLAVQSTKKYFAWLHYNISIKIGCVILVPHVTSTSFLVFPTAIRLPITPLMIHRPLISSHVSYLNMLYRLTSISGLFKKFTPPNLRTDLDLPVLRRVN